MGSWKRRQAALALRAVAILAVLLGVVWTLLSLAPGIDRAAQAQGGFSAPIEKVIVDASGADITDSYAGEIFLIDISSTDATCSQLSNVELTVTPGQIDLSVQLVSFGGAGSCAYTFTEQPSAGWSTDQSSVGPILFEDFVEGGAGVEFRNSPFVQLFVDKTTTPTDLDANLYPDNWQFRIENDGVADSRCLFDDTIQINIAGTEGIGVPSIAGFGASECTYTVTETAVDGWTTAPASGVVSGVLPGGTAQFTNTLQTGGILITKDSTLLGDTTEFEFTIGGGPTTRPPFELFDGQTRIELQLLPGDYTLSETDPGTNYETTWACSDESENRFGGSGLSQDVSLVGDGAIECVVTNRFRAGTVTVIKETVPSNSATSFAFTASAGATPSSFSLDGDGDDNDGTPSSQVFADLVPGSYTFSETLPDGWVGEVACVNAGDNSSVATGTTSASFVLAPDGDVVCTFTNEQLATIRVSKESSLDDDATVFSFAGSDPIGAFQLDDDGSDTPLPASRTFQVPAGTYTLTETVPDGYDAAFRCAGADFAVPGNSTTFSVTAGQNYGCTFVNTAQLSTIVFTKTVVSSTTDSSAFAFQLLDSADAVLFSSNLEDGSTGTVAALTPGTYRVVETPRAGYSLSIDCAGDEDSLDNDTGTATITVGLGEIITCEFTNTALGTIVITKDATPDQATSFGFTGTTPIGDFQLADGMSRTQSGLAAGTYTVSEVGVAGFDVFINCTGDLDGGNVVDGPGVAIDLDPGETIVCTFTNEEQSMVTIVKDEQPDLGTSFTFNAPGLVDGGSFTLSDDGADLAAAQRQFTGVSAGTYIVSETLVDGYTTSVECPDVAELAQTTTDTELQIEVEVDLGADITCTFTNTKLASIEIAKTTVPAGQGPFTFSNNLAVDIPALSDGETFTLGALEAGTVELAEAAATGWSTEVECIDLATNAAISTGGLAATVELAVGQDVRCTWTNTQLGAVEIVKVTDPGSDPELFSFTTTGLSPASFVLDTDSASATPNQQSFSLVAPGAYTVAEPALAGWTSTASCDDDDSTVATADSGTTASITVAPGETVRCTFVNTKLGSVAVVKQVEPVTGDSFTFTASGLTPDAFTLGDGELRLFNDVAAGTYVVSEEVLEGYDASVDCASAPAASIEGAEVTIDLAPGEQVVCTWTNVQRPGELVIVKSASPSDSQDFLFAVAGSGLASPIEVLLDDDSDPTLPNTWSDATLPAGTYVITEAAAADWLLDSLVCDDPTGDTVIDGSSATVALAPGETVTCTFNNLLNLGTIVVVQDTIEDNPQDFSFVTGGLDPAEFVLDDDDDPALANRRTFFVETPELPPTDNPVDAAIQAAALMPGSYTVTGIGATGWTTTLSCVDPDNETVTTELLAEIDLDAGETVTCTYVSRRDTGGGGDPVVPEFETDPTPVPETVVPVAAAVPDEILPLALTGSTASLPTGVGLGLTALGFALLAVDRRLRRGEAED